MKYTIEIPDELHVTIASIGYDLNSYFNEVFIKPLVIKHRQFLEDIVLETVRPEIDAAVTKVIDEVIFEAVVDKSIEDIPKQEPPIADGSDSGL